jgi:hypothetical protein
MDIDTSMLSAYVLPLASLFLVAASAFALIRVHLVLSSTPVALPDDKDRALNARVAELTVLCRKAQSEQASLAAVMADIRRELNAMNRLDRLLVDPAKADRAPAMELAARLARGGASIDELKTNCGLTIGEANLMRRLHGCTAAAQVS